LFAFVLCPMLPVSLQFAPGFYLWCSYCTFHPVCVFTFLVPCFDVHYDFGMKTIFRSSYPHLFVWGFMSHLWYLCLLRIEVSHILSYHMSVRFQFRVVMSA
jgi:hypothetical protein